MTDEDGESLVAAAERIAAELPALRAQLRRRTRLIAWLLAAVLLAAVGVTAGGFLVTRMVFCQFFVDLQPRSGEPQPVGEYGHRILNDARSTAERLRC